MDNASVALLMLDIASAKSTLKELQHAFTAASAEHHRTKHQLHDLEQELDVNPLYIVHRGKGTAAACDKATAQQLQALHTENLQLKSLLKQEIEARQLLEAKHSALMQVLRSCGLLLTPAADQSGSSTGVSSRGCKHQSKDAVIVQQTKVAAATEEQKVPMQQHKGSSCFTVPTAKHASAFQEASSSAAQSAAHSSGTRNLAAAADARCPAGQTHAIQDSSMEKQPKQPAAGTQHVMHNFPACLSSAYFPNLYQQTGQISTTGAQAASSTHVSYELQGASKPVPVADGWHGMQYTEQQSNNSGSSWQCLTPQQHPSEDELVLQQQQQKQQQQMPVMTGWEHPSPEQTTATCAATRGSSYCSTASPSNTSNHSHDSPASELLDSEDLEELACLYDGLIGQQAGSRQPDALAAAAAVASAVNAAGEASSAAASGASLQRSNNVSHASSSMHPRVQQQQQIRPALSMPVAQPQPPPHTIPPKMLPGMDVLAAQLHELQQQVFMDSNLIRRHSSSSSGSSVSANPTTARGPAAAADRETVGIAAASGTGTLAVPVMCKQQPSRGVALCDMRDSLQHNTQAGSNSYVVGGSSKVYHGSIASEIGSSTQQQAGVQSAGVMADLQQQLAQRMLEVKQRLSNICNGMLEEACTANNKLYAAHEASIASAATQPGPTPAPAVHHRSTAPATSYAGNGGLHGQWQLPLQQPASLAVAEAEEATSAAGGVGAGLPSSSSWGTSSSSENGSARIAPQQKSQQQNGRYHSKDNAMHPGQKGTPAYEVQVDVRTRRFEPGASGVMGTQQQGAHTRARVRQPRLCNLQVPDDTACDGSARLCEAAAADACPGVPTAAASDEQHAPSVVAGHCGCCAEAQGDYLDAAEGVCSDSSWSTCEVEDEQQQQQQQMLDDAQESRQQYCQAHAIDTPQGTPDRVRSHGASSRSSSSDGSSPSMQQQIRPDQYGRRMWQQPEHQPEKRSCMSESLEGALFGMGVRVAAEVSQTFSPLKGAPPSGQAMWSPGSRLTPLKPRNA